jgi:hypothetical protein
MLHTLIYISIVQLAAKDWQLLPEEHNVWREIKSIGKAIEIKVHQQIRQDLETFKGETE